MTSGPGIAVLVLGVALLCVGPVSWWAIGSAAGPDVDYVIEDINDSDAMEAMIDDTQDMEAGEEFTVLIKNVDAETIYGLEMVFGTEDLKEGDDVIITYRVDEMFGTNVPLPISAEKYDPPASWLGEATGPLVGALLIGVGVSLILVGVILVSKARRAGPYSRYPLYPPEPYTHRDYQRYGSDYPRYGRDYPRYGPPTRPEYIDPYTRQPPWDRPYSDQYSRSAPGRPRYDDDPYVPSYREIPTYDHDYRPGPERRRYYEEL